MLNVTKTYKQDVKTTKMKKWNNVNKWKQNQVSSAQVGCQQRTSRGRGAWEQNGGKVYIVGLHIDCRSVGGGEGIVY